jgi:hypothetical protein
VARAHLAHDGEALQLALTDDISRFGPQAKRDGGFRPIFVGFAKLSVPCVSVSKLPALPNSHTDRLD